MDLTLKEDGLKLIFEQGYKLEDLRKFIEESPAISERCSFIKQSDDLEKIYRDFLQILKEELTLDEITLLFVVACMLYFIDAKPANSEWRFLLLQRTFCYVDTLTPMHLHVAAKRLYEGLKLGISYVFNILNICNQISVINDTGRAIAICLMWAILCEITETECEMYCFRRFPQLIKMLTYIDDEVLQMENSTQVVYILVQCIGFLTNSIVFGRNNVFKRAGYEPYFRYSVNDLKKLVEWAENLCRSLEVSVSKTNNYWDLRMAISEYLQSNISAVLQDKISDIQPQLAAK